jgi:hypothetical protein
MTRRVLACRGWCCAGLLVLTTAVGCDDAPRRGDVGPDSATADMALVDGRSTDIRSTDGRHDSSSPDSHHDGPPVDTAPKTDTGGGGTILLQENFEDSNFSQRGWYDAPKGTLTTAAKEGKSAFECLYKKGAKGCAGGTPGRHAITPTESLYVSYWVKYSTNFVGSGKSYHPHEFNFVTTADSKYIGPAFTYLTGYIEQVGGVPRLALQDSKNVDMSCILLNNGSSVGCNGDFKTYAFTEKRSVCACNGIMGDLDGKDCFKYGTGYYSARFWDATSKYFTDQPGPTYKNDWHLIEVFFKMNSVTAGKGAADGIIRYWYDGKLIVNHSKILMRTGQHPTLKFNQFLFGNYIGDGSPVDQKMWVDRLIVATGKP